MLQQFHAYSEKDPSDSEVVYELLNVKLDKNHVLDIYRIRINMEYAIGSSSGVLSIVMGLLNCRANKKIVSISAFNEFSRRRNWITRRRFRYTVAANASNNEEHSVDFFVPYTVWDTPTLTYAVTSGLDFTLAVCDCEIHGKVRLATREEMETLEIRQRPPE